MAHRAYVFGTSFMRLWKLTIAFFGRYLRPPPPRSRPSTKHCIQALHCLHLIRSVAFISVTIISRLFNTFA